MCETVLFYYFGHFREKKKGINTKKKLILKTCICWLSLLYMKSKVEQMSYVSFAWCVKTDKYRQLQISPLSFNSVWNAVPNWLGKIPWPKSYGSVPADPPMWWFGYSSVLWPHSQCCCCEFQFVVGSPAVHPCFGCMMVSDLNLFISDTCISSAGVVSVHWCIASSDLFAFVTFAIAFYDLKGL